MKGISEIIATILMLMITLALVGSAYVFIFGIFQQKTRGISLVDAFCSTPTGTIVIRNDGQDTIKVSEQTLIPVSAPCTPPALVDIGPNTNTVYTFTGCTGATTHSYRLIGPSNSVPISFRCA
ncbi:MAG: type IV pilin N-terminal domain-containing protein [Candidatus Aenigmarchaeota archaeon]|nr:type IV pilin N-terminal domain-containing protein [Candidatus Aenigmarchaeota archaeon]